MFLNIFKTKLCDCWACKNVRAGGGYQPCHNRKGSGQIKQPPKKP